MIKIGSLRSNNKLWFTGIIEFGYYKEDLDKKWATWKSNIVTGLDIQDCIVRIAEDSRSCITESNLERKHDLERILRRYKSSWQKISDYDKNKEKS